MAKKRLTGPKTLSWQNRNVSSSGRGRKTALVTSSIALGAFVTGRVFRKLRNINLCSPQDVPKALDARVREMEMMEGRVRFYEHEGVGTPIVLLHDLHPAASSFEVKPLFDHLVASTSRPVFALDWLGFGRSDRPPIRYTPTLYQRQLRRFLSEHVHQPADLIACSRASEYAALAADTFPYLFRKQIHLAPDDLPQKPSLLQRALLEVAGSTGTFEIFFHRLSRPGTLRHLYAERFLGKPSDVPAALVDYACLTTEAYGAHHAPRYLAEGLLCAFSNRRRIYENMQVPTLIITPDDTAPSWQDLAERNKAVLTLKTLPSGFMPQWEAPEVLFRLVDAFLSENAPHGETTG